MSRGEELARHKLLAQSPELLRQTEKLVQGDEPGATGAQKGPGEYKPPAAEPINLGLDQIQRALGAPESPPDLLSYARTDVGNGDRLIAMHQHDMRYCAAFKKWLVWDGRRWMADETQQSRYLAKLTLLEYQGQAIESKDEPSEKFARASMELKQIESMLKLVQYEFRILPRELDADPWLLNFRNGTVDLRDGELRLHRREDFITRLVHYDYKPDAPRLGWLMFLERVMGGGLSASEAEQKQAWDFIAYLQRALGYSLTGVTREKAIFIPFGKGDNGKSTMLTVFRELISEYAVLLQVDTLMVRQESSNSQADLADLRGARFVQTSEAEEGQRLAQGKLKRITQGMGDIKAVRKYENPIVFPETHKLWIDTNRKPIIRDADDRATFNRLQPIPFTVQIPQDEIDKDMPNKLAREAEGILAWAVEGARLWNKSGLSKPEEIEKAREAYRAEMDQIGRFLEECCEQKAASSAAPKQLYTAYKDWCEASGERPETSNMFGRRMTDRGFIRDEHHPRYEGIELKHG